MCAHLAAAINAALTTLAACLAPCFVACPWCALQALLRAEWEAANTAEVLRAVSEPPGEHTIAGQLLLVKDPSTNQRLTPDQLKAELVIAALAGAAGRLSCFTLSLLCDGLQ